MPIYEECWSVSDLHRFTEVGHLPGFFIIFFIPAHLDCMLPAKHGRIFCGLRIPICKGRGHVFALL